MCGRHLMMMMFVFLALVGAACAAPARSRLNVTTSTVACTAAIRRFVFVKTHKTGSSTVVAVLHRFVWSQDLVVAMPANLVNFGHQLTRTSDILSYVELVSRHGPVTVVMNHLEYTPQVAGFLREKLIPKTPDTRYFTILREPLKAFTSQYCYYHFDRALSAKQRQLVPLPSTTPYKAETCAVSFSAFLSRQKEFTDTAAVMFNMQSRDLGLPDSAQRATGAAAKSAALALTQRLDAQLDFVLLTDYFDESMVLLKRHMCWGLDDILYEALKVVGTTGAATRPATATRILTANERAVVARYLAVDVLLYAHYNDTFWRRVAAAGPGFAAEVAAFRSLLRDFHRTCDAVSTQGAEKRGRQRVVRERCDMAKWDNEKFSRKLVEKYGLDDNDASNVTSVLEGRQKSQTARRTRRGARRRRNAGKKGGGGGGRG